MPCNASQLFITLTCALFRASTRGFSAAKAEPAPGTTRCRPRVVGRMRWYDGCSLLKVQRRCARAIGPQYFVGEKPSCSFHCVRATHSLAPPRDFTRLSSGYRLTQTSSRGRNPTERGGWCARAIRPRLVGGIGRIRSTLACFWLFEQSCFDRLVTGYRRIPAALSGDPYLVSVQRYPEVRLVLFMPKRGIPVRSSSSREELPGSHQPSNFTRTCCNLRLRRRSLCERTPSEVILRVRY